MSLMVPLLVTLAPELAAGLFGPNATTWVKAAEQAVRDATGADSPDAAQAVLARDPQAAARLRVDLARLAAEAMADARAVEASGLANSVRAGLSSSPGPTRSGAPTATLVSLVVLLAFAGAIWAALTRTLPPGSETVATLLLGTLASLATSVVSYWVGSSAGSAVKTELLFGGRAAAVSPPAGMPAPAAQSASRA